ncbi:putative dinucleotide-binding enzyme [Thermobifida halotolerans]
MHSTRPLHLGILGAGRIGSTLARHWVRAGHTVVLGSRSPERLTDLVGELGPRASADTAPRAARHSDVVVLAVPHTALAATLDAVGTALDGKVVVDTTNPVTFSPDGRIVSTLPEGRTAGEATAALLPRSRVVRAFTHVMYELLASRGLAQPLLWAMTIAGDDADAKRTVADLVRDTGFTPVDIGSLAESAPLDPGGALFPQTSTAADLLARIA